MHHAPCRSLGYMVVRMGGYSAIVCCLSVCDVDVRRCTLIAYLEFYYTSDQPAVSQLFAPKLRRSSARGTP